MDEFVARELQTFGETLRERVRHKLRTVETVMETEIGLMNEQLRSLRELLWRDREGSLYCRVTVDDSSKFPQSLVVRLRGMPPCCQ